MDFEKRVNSNDRSIIFENILEIIGSNPKYTNLCGKMHTMYRIMFNDGHGYNISIVKNKTCYTVYIAKHLTLKKEYI